MCEVAPHQLKITAASIEKAMSAFKAFPPYLVLKLTNHMLKAMQIDD